MGEIIIIEGVVIGIEVTIGIGVDHLKGRVGQVLEQVQTEIELDVLNVGNMTILQENVQLDQQVGRQNKYNKCLIWMKIRQYCKPH